MCDVCGQIKLSYSLLVDRIDLFVHVTHVLVHRVVESLNPSWEVEELGSVL